jgi:transcriptional regulator with GAF, ATPase, and Fis domain
MEDIGLICFVYIAIMIREGSLIYKVFLFDFRIEGMMNISLQELWSSIVNKLNHLETQVEAASVVLFGTSTDEGILVLPLGRSLRALDVLGARSNDVDVKKLVQDILHTETYRTVIDGRLIRVFLPDSRAGLMVVLPIVSNRRPVGLLILGVDVLPEENVLHGWQKEAQLIGEHVVACQGQQTMHKREIQLQLIHRLSQQDVSEMSLNDFYDLAVVSIREELNYYNVSLFMPDEPNYELVLRAHTGAYQIQIEKGYRQSLDVGILGWVARHKKMCLVQDVRKDERYFGYDFLNTRSEICFPIILSDQLAGVLNVESDLVNAFDEGDVIALEALAQQIGDVIQVHQQREALARLKEEVGERHPFGDLLGQSEAMRQVFALVKTVAKSDLAVLIRGETGTGKELIARAIHRESDRKDKPFVAVNCAAVPESLFESELFGHERGAFTSAESRRIGKMEMADGGTLLLDEVGEIPISMQAKLLRAIESQTFTRVGGEKEIEVNIRLLSATNQPLEELEQRGEFRRDLYFRLNAVQVHLPPLRERVEDIPLLARHFLKAACGRFGKGIGHIETLVLAKLLAHSWPGNVREMENVIARAVLLETEGVLSQVDLEQGVRLLQSEVRVLPDGAGNMSLKQACRQALEEVELAYLRLVLTSVKGNVSRAAELAGITRRTLYNKMDVYGIRRIDFLSE